MAIWASFTVSFSVLSSVATMTILLVRLLRTGKPVARRRPAVYENSELSGYSSHTRLDAAFFAFLDAAVKTSTGLSLAGAFALGARSVYQGTAAATYRKFVNTKSLF